MKLFRRLLCLALVLSMVLSTGVLEALALGQDSNSPEVETTGELVDLSEMFVVEETQPEQTEKAMNEPEALEPVTFVQTKAAVTGEAEGFSYTVLENGNCSVTGYTGGVTEDLVIPDTLDGYTVSAIGNQAFKGSAFVSIHLPDSVTTIGNGAFQNCTALKEINYPLNLKSVGSGVWSGIFSGCTALGSIVVPEGVTALPDSVFFYAESLKSVTLPSTLVTIGNNAFDHSGITAIDLPDGVTGIGDYAFRECTALENVELGSSLTYIGAYAFDGCAALTSLVLPNTVETMEYGAFHNCVKLASVTYPANLKKTTNSLWTGVFTGCTALESMEIPEGVTALPDHVFYYAEGLKSVKLPSTLTSIGNHAFDNTALTAIDLPDGVTSIGDYAFNACVMLESVELGSSLTSVGSFAFAECKSLTTMDLPDTVESIDNSAFKNCASLESFTYPASLKSVESGFQSGIFSGCTALESIVVPEGVTALPDNVFYYANALKSVTLPSSLTSVGRQAFMGCGMDTVVLPSGVTTIGNYAFNGCIALENIQVGSSLVTIGNNAFSGCKALTQIVLPDTVETIGANAFTNCEKLASFTYPVNLKSVGDNWVTGGVFSGCSALEFVEIPEGVTTVPENVFKSAESLKFVSLPSTLTSIGDYAFQNSGLMAVILPKDVKTIGIYAFSGCSQLQSVYLGDSLTTIGDFAFEGCAKLESVDFPDTVESIRSSAFRNCTSLKTVDILGALKNLGSAAFYGCTALESVVLNDDITYLQGHTFYDCSSLRSVHLPRNLKQIQNCAFAECVSLTELYIPDSVNFIANNAFEGVPEMTFRCDPRSYATEYALDHQFAIIPTKTDDTEVSGPLNTDNSYYIHNYDGLSAAGVMSMVVHYEMQEDAAVKPTEVTVHVYDFAALQENTLTLDGKLCTNYTYDEETGRLTVPVEANSGTIRFCMKPLRYEALTSYARLVYKDSKGQESAAIIGSVNSLMPALNISAPEETSLDTIHVNGLAVPEAEVSLYLDGVFVKTVKANKVGDYAADISLGEPVDEKEYIITAEAADRSGNLVVAQANVVYRYDAPELVDFVMIYDAHMERRVSLMEIGDLRPVVVFNPKIPFRFEMKFTNPDALSDVFVVSTRNNVKQYLKAYWSEALGAFVAEGYFDPEDHSYVPGVLSLEYVCGGERVSFEQEVDFSSPEVIEALPQVWKDADIEIVKDEEGELVLDITGGYDEEQISFDLSITTQEIPDYLTPETAEDYGYTRIVDDFGKELFIRPRGGSGSGGGGSGGGHGHSAPQFSVLDFAADEVTDYIIDEVQDAFGDALLKEGLGPVGDAFDIIFTIQDGIGTGKDIEELRDICAKNPDLTAEQKQLFNEKAAEAHFINVFGSIIQCALAGASIYAAIAFPPALPILAVGSVAVGGIFDLSMKLRMWDLTASAYGLNIKFRWSIDPSGYVYDEVTGIRLEGVTVHAYWVEYTEEDTDFWDDKPGDDEYGVLWDSLEFSQLNPLVTDTEGRYAWDVPEGWWRVSYEKEGYESTWSQWLPVPPPQTEVNIGMKPLVAEHIHTIVTIPGKAATCTETGLTEGKKCSQCGEITVEQKEIPVTAHTEVAITGKAATCTKDGLSEGKKCAKCGEVLIKQVVIVALGHSMVSHGAKAPTCTKKGHKAYESCSRCDYTTYQEVAATGHGYDNILDGTCNSCGVNRADVENRKVVHMFRMYNPNTGEHFYTGSTVERDNLIGHGWQYEGVGFTFPANTGAPVHRLFQPSTGEHLYTMDEAEKDKLMAEGWNYEGIAFNSAYDTEAVQHRLHNPNATVGAYHFTFSTEERDTLISLGWEYQGIGWYSCWK